MGSHSRIVRCVGVCSLVVAGCGDAGRDDDEVGDAGEMSSSVGNDVEAGTAEGSDDADQGTQDGSATTASRAPLRTTRATTRRMTTTRA